VKHISQSGINLTRSGARPKPARGSPFMCLVWTDTTEPIDEELDAAIETVDGVTWTVEDNGSIWEGAIYGRDLEQVESARRYLIESRGWHPEEVEPADE
jgi:hypothetical protein